VHDDLSDRLRELVRHAQAGGAPASWLEETAHALVTLILDNAELRRALGPSRLKALQDKGSLAQFLRSCRILGYPAGAMAAAAKARFGISKSTYYRRRQAVAPNPNRSRITAPSNDC
jgi:hypothetical protein